ncbi:HET-domain-containing protein [Hyaloscypha hepaticicola]|uniref:HET-domain-containing protein n=1 Tax=Hyaloscypha hepaticicola TaxID=2082293 RepID=A0A2J6QGL3_9HELO|nr:HET-domain-containing protein [Hyaloscypha hepaticicola]
MTLESPPYKDLTSDQIRLLRIEPGNDNDPIICSLEYTNLASPQEYEALSYTWGSPEPPRYVCCEGRQVKVTKNLYDAICQFRSLTSERMLWADAICINQNDNKEKSEQVRRMRDIYSKARELFIWLGHPVDPMDADIAVDTMVRLSSILLKSATELQFRLNGVIEAPSGASLSARIREHMYGAEIQHGECAALGRLYLCSWFQRVWIVQEAISIPDGLDARIKIAYGGRDFEWVTLSIVTAGLAILNMHAEIAHAAGANIDSLPWELIRDIELSRATEIIDILGSDEETVCRQAHEATERALQKGTKKIIESRLIYPENQFGGLTLTTRNSQIYMFLSLSRRLQSSEPRDKIFSFIGMVEKAIVNHDMLAPNYDKSVADVYIDLTWYFIHHAQILDIFEYLYDQPAEGNIIPGLPSWANDWTQRSTLPLFASTRFSAGGKTADGFSDIAKLAELSEDRRKLKLKVYPLDVIRGCVKTVAELVAQYIQNRSLAADANEAILSEEDRMRLELAKYRDILRLTVQLVSNIKLGRQASMNDETPLHENDISVEHFSSIPYFTGDSLWEALWRTLVCDITAEGGKPSEDIGLACRVYHDCMTSLLFTGADPPGLSPHDEALATLFTREYSRYTKCRRFFTTSKVMGWVTSRAEPGDFVCVIPGARLPYVIRATENSTEFELIGQAWAYGFMEVEEGCDAPRVQSQYGGKPIDIWLV